MTDGDREDVVVVEVTGQQATAFTVTHQKEIRLTQPARLRGTEAHLLLVNHRH